MIDLNDFHPYGEKPITHVVVVTQPFELRRWAVSEELANSKAEEYRQKGWTAHVEPFKTVKERREQSCK